MSIINIVLADDHQVVRAGIKRILSNISGVKIVGEAADGEEAIRLVREKRPHIVLMDLRMPKVDGIEATKRLHQSCPDTHVLILTGLNDDPIPSQVLQVEGVSGYLTKDASAEELERALLSVSNGQRYISSSLAQKLALNPTQESSENPFGNLSERELQVMHMLIEGKKVMAISEILSVNPKTVNSYRYRIFEKLGIDSDVELTHLAIRYGIIE